MFLYSFQSFIAIIQMVQQNILKVIMPLKFRFQIMHCSLAKPHGFKYFYAGMMKKLEKENQ